MILPLDNKLISILYLIYLVPFIGLPFESIPPTSSESAFYLSVPCRLDSAASIYFSQCLIAKSFGNSSPLTFWNVTTTSHVFNHSFFLPYSLLDSQTPWASVFHLHVWLFSLPDPFLHFHILFVCFRSLLYFYSFSLGEISIILLQWTCYADVF